VESRAQPRPSSAPATAAGLLLACAALACAGDDQVASASATTGVGPLTEVTGAPTTATTEGTTSDETGGARPSTSPW
jgi:hypothetical protein